jgi:hypothetical protein
MRAQSSPGAKPARDDATSATGQSPRDTGGEGQSLRNGVTTPYQPVNGRAPHIHPYIDDDGCIVWQREVRTKDGVEVISTQLTNFKARIITDIIRDDGVETVRHYEIAATLGDRPFRFEIPAARFSGMTWVHEHLGAGAIVAPGQGMPGRLLNAIQYLSKELFEERHVYAHTGWREIDGALYYLDAGGALGAKGRRIDIDVSLPPQLQRHQLIERQDEADLLKAARECILLHKVAPMRVLAPMMGAAYRAPLGPSDISGHAWGPTGRGKSEVAAIVQQHFGPGLNARHLPMSWEDTANTVEMVLSIAKDTLVVVDEYVPGETQAARASKQQKAERVFRAQGNATGRARMRADTSLRAPRPPRGQLLSTGEELPAGQSLRARTLGST